MSCTQTLCLVRRRVAKRVGFRVSKVIRAIVSRQGLIESTTIAGQVAEFMDEGVSPGSAFHVTLDKNDDLVWSAETNGSKVEFDTDPETGLWQRFVIDVTGLLPIEEQL